MYLIAIAWIYVVLMMSLAEAMHPTGTVLGAVLTFLMYGLGPVSLVIYLLGGKFRRQARTQADSTAARDAPLSTPDVPAGTPSVPGGPDVPDTAPRDESELGLQPHGNGHAASKPVATVGKEA